MKLSVKQHKEAGETYWCILSYCFLIPLFLLVSNVLTVTNTISDCLFDVRWGRINLGTFGAAFTSRFSGISGSLMPLSRPISDSMSAAQSSSLSFGLSKSPFQVSQFLVSEMLSGALSLSHSTGCPSILLLRQIFNIGDRLPRRSFADKAGGNGDLSDILNAAAPSCWNFDQDALTISSISQMYATAVTSLFWVPDSFCVACRFGFCATSPKSRGPWPLCAIFLSSDSFFISKVFSVCFVSNTGWSPANNPLLSRAHCLTMTSSPRVSPVVLDCLQPITSLPREKLAFTPTVCGMIEIMSRAKMERSAYFEWVSSCYPHQSVISGNNNVLLIFIGLVWQS